jgi:hypothetical protein
MNQKYTFLWALILTIVIFNIGIFLGYQLEQSRINKINEWYIETDLELLDQKVQSEAFDLVNFGCDSLVKENIAFANTLYEEALKIQKYEDANRISADIIIQHKKFDLLRSLFWMNSIKIKQKCNLDYHNVVYFYQYNNPTLEQQAKQKSISNLLMETKQEKGDKITLIPIAGDNELPSINLLLNKYNITQQDLPVILIDEKVKIVDIDSKEDILKYLK